VRLTASDSRNLEAVKPLWIQEIALRTRAPPENIKADPRFEASLLQCVQRFNGVKPNSNTIELRHPESIASDPGSTISMRSRRPAFNRALS